MRKKILGLIVLCVSLIAASNSYATSSGSSWSSSDVREVNYLTPGSQKTQLGTRLQGPLMVGYTTSSTAATYAAGQASAYATPTTALYIKATGNSYGESYLLGNGVQNQPITWVLATSGSKAFTITPLTATGFTKAALTSDKQSVTMKYDETKGWFVTGNNGATIN